jgi:hypothetical protein
MREVTPPTTTAIHMTGRLWSQSFTYFPLPVFGSGFQQSLYLMMPIFTLHIVAEFSPKVSALPGRAKALAPGLVPRVENSGESKLA